MNNDWINKGNQFYKDGLYKEAVQCYDQALKLDPKNIAVWNNRGLSLANLGLHEEAIQSYSNALKFNTQYFNAWSNLGISLDALKEFEKALICFDKALELNPKHALTWRQKGDVLYKLGRHEEGDYCSEQVLKLVVPESSLFKSTSVLLSKRKKDVNLPVNHKENISSQNPSIGQDIAEQTTNRTYQPGDVIGQEY